MFEEPRSPQPRAHSTSVGRGVVHVHEDQVGEYDWPKKGDRTANTYDITRVQYSRLRGGREVVRVENVGLTRGRERRLRSGRGGMTRRLRLPFGFFVEAGSKVAQS